MSGNKVSGVAKIEEIFKFHFDDKILQDVIDSIRGDVKIVIPKYQREYNWKEEKIKTFVNDIYKRSKFLGIISLERNKEQNTLDVVDGQQRITTLILFMIALYNMLIDIGETLSADNIKCLLERSNSFNFRNDSVADFIKKDGNKYVIEIDDTKDIYRQSKKFTKAYELICGILKQKYAESGRQSGGYAGLVEAANHICDCDMVLFISTEQRNEGSIEEIYIDINEKAQKLDHEDIFKGYCFSKIKNSSQQEELKTKWIEIKENYFKLSNFKTKNLSSLLHMFLLIETCTDRITENLYLDGKHYLSDLQPTEIMHLLDRIIKFESNLVQYENSINDFRYKFENIIIKNRSVESDLQYLKEISKFILYSTLNIYKLPFYHYINVSILSENKMEYKIFKSFLVSYYIYAYIYTCILKVRNRECLSIDVLKAINEKEKVTETLVDVIQEIVNDEKKYYGINTKKNNLKMLYSIIDTADSQRDGMLIQEVKLKSYLDETYEHLVVNESLKVSWLNNDGTVFTYDQTDLYKEMKSKKEDGMNFILMPKTENNELENKDIVDKIGYLETTSLRRRKHIAIFIEYIKKLHSFGELKQIKIRSENRAVVLEKYKEFLNEYFMPENLSTLTGKLDTTFVSTINNL